MNARGFVRAVLVPHRRENSEFGECRHPADQFQNAIVLVRLEPVAGDEFGGDLRFISRHLIGQAARSRCATSPANRPRPSVQPMMSSTWFSGCGIMPSTLPCSLITPAIECAAPFIFARPSTAPFGEQ